MRLSEVDFTYRPRLGCCPKGYRLSDRDPAAGGSRLRFSVAYEPRTTIPAMSLGEWRRARLPPVWLCEIVSPGHQQKATRSVRDTNPCGSHLAAGWWMRRAATLAHAAGSIAARLIHPTDLLYLARPDTPALPFYSPVRQPVGRRAEADRLIWENQGDRLLNLFAKRSSIRINI